MFSISTRILGNGNVYSLFARDGFTTTITTKSVRATIQNQPTKITVAPEVYVGNRSSNATTQKQQE